MYQSDFILIKSVIYMRTIITAFFFPQSMSKSSNLLSRNSKGAKGVKSGLFYNSPPLYKK
jgi:hypothetical protein